MLLSLTGFLGRHRVTDVFPIRETDFQALTKSSLQCIDQSGFQLVGQQMLITLVEAEAQFKRRAILTRAVFRQLPRGTVDRL